MRAVPSAFLCFLLSCASMIAPVTWAQSATASSAIPTDAFAALEQARALIDRGQPAAALGLLEPFGDILAGDPDYDYPLALATLDSGDSLGSTLIFERLLAIRPSFHGARIDLGRAYYNLGRWPDARREFETAGAAGPPEPAAKVIRQYLTQIDRIERDARFSRYVTVGTRTGYDSNVNSATALTEFLGFGLNEQSREQDSEFFEAGLSAGFSLALNSTLRLGARAAGRFRRNGQASFADSDVAALALRLDQSRGGQHRFIGLDAFTLYLDGRRNSTAFALSGHWLFDVGTRWSVGPTFRLGQVRFEDALAVKDVDQWSLGAMARTLFGSDGQGALTTAVAFGEDRPTQDGSRYARDAWLWNTNVNWAFSERLTSALGLSVEQGLFDNVFFEQVFSEPREDLAVRARGAVDWRLGSRWRLQHSLSYRMNDTDVSVFEFERFEATLGLRYVWH